MERRCSQGRNRLKLACGFETKTLSLCHRSRRAVYIRGILWPRKRKAVVANIKKRINFVKNVLRLKIVKSVLILVVVRKRSSSLTEGEKEQFFTIVLLEKCV